MRILVADGHSITRRGLAALIWELYPEAEVCEAEDGEQAAALAAREDWDLVTLGLALPRQNGFEVLQAIRAVKSALPVMVFSYLDSREHVSAAFGFGARGFVSKRGELADVQAGIRALLRGQRFVCRLILQDFGYIPWLDSSFSGGTN